MAEISAVGLDDDRQNAWDPAILIEDRAVVDVEPSLLRLSLALQRDSEIAIGQRLARKHRRDDLAVELGQFRPMLEE